MEAPHLPCFAFELQAGSGLAGEIRPAATTRLAVVPRRRERAYFSPVDDLLRADASAKPLRAKPSEECSDSHLDADRLDAAVGLREIDVGGTNDLGPFRVDDLLVEYVVCECDVGRVPLDRARKCPGRAQGDG